MVDRRLIQYWICSIPDSIPEDALDDLEAAQLHQPERSPVKRIQHHEVLQDNNSASEFDEGGHASLVTRSLPSQSSSITKRSKRMPKYNLNNKPIAPARERNSLRFLEKPVHMKSLTLNPSQLPEDVRDLYTRIQSSAIYKEGIVPSEVREEINAMLNGEVREASFGKPLAPTDETGRATAAVRVLHTQVCEILEAAGTSESQRRDEGGWNAHVHGPVLGLVFTSLLSRAGFKPQQSRRVAARYEAVYAATITKDSAPCWEDGSSAVTVSSTEQSADDSSDRSEKPESIPDRRRTKKVDYVVVLKSLDDKPLQQAIQQAAFNKETNTCYVNQIAYNPIFDAPIAVSIETKKSSSHDDRILHLGLWVAAWHKRMYALRQRSFSSPPPPLQLVSVPLIQVAGHDWNLYFACDSVSSISMYGPISLGSTRNILDLYALITCLLLIQDWVETTFYERIRTWFLDSGNMQKSTEA
ncbi:hypothetical protein O1611_g7251 [Lasiodiplodia mahajangana]|uniref:Uncharacterized protein n=1 Tax=Lasiodiplodia mahajangana TaxID=1108764 RepID=A0ACC2JGF2_9PEZI|nr:hypothetical protein O1611_g7251 [Lasiodiplodia mahajangana]